MSRSPKVDTWEPRLTTEQELWDQLSRQPQHWPIGGIKILPGGWENKRTSRDVFMHLFGEKWKVGRRFENPETKSTWTILNNGELIRQSGKIGNLGPREHSKWPQALQVKAATGSWKAVGLTEEQQLTDALSAFPEYWGPGETKMLPGKWENKRIAESFFQYREGQEWIEGRRFSTPQGEYLLSNDGTLRRRQTDAKLGAGGWE